MELVKWQFRNPYHDAQHDTLRTFTFGPHTVAMNQQPDQQIDLHQNTGFLIWDGAYILSKFLYTHAPLTNRSCLELGAGNALVSIVARLAGASRVMATDLAEYLDFIRSNVSQNKALPGSSVEIEVQELVWGSEGQDVGQFDVVVGSEILYLEGLHGALLETVRRAMHAESVAYFVYKDRALGEHTFQDTAVQHGFRVKELPRTFLDSEFQDDRYHLLRLQLSE
ncbi:Methyltransferase-like protein 21B [Linderina macrospora]|uniref:Methyltransferase-like protein 21B n=1 Tax=Linderina macrospora TaxID=4868 RepID=A0ACC1J6M4_9FUNG|nr:Methyltransferase-like protein 21B [Linderina macrospora]